MNLDSTMKTNLVVVLLLFAIKLTVGQVASSNSNSGLRKPLSSMYSNGSELLITVRCSDAEQCEILGRQMTEAVGQETNVKDNPNETFHWVIEVPKQACLDRLVPLNPKPTGVRKILYWTNKTKQMGFSQDKQPFIDGKCIVNNCEVTYDRQLLYQSDAIIFHAGHFNSSQLPATKLPHQRYIVYLPDTFDANRTAKIFSNEFESFFDWTMSYRQDSDIINGKLSGAIRWKTSSPEELPMALAPGKKPSMPDSLLKPAKKSKRSKLLSFYCQPNQSNTNSKREKLIDLLEKQNISVVMHGDCGPNLKTCQPTDSLECKNSLADSMFILSAESSLCPDFVTDQLYRALENNVVPVVYGGAEYAKYAPPGSYINVADFASPKDLAAYLNLLNANEALYQKYFEWKRDYELVLQPLNGWCDLCAKLNEPIKPEDKPPKSRNNLAKWWFDDIPCYSGVDVLNKFKNGPV